ncbi:hypothetical protein [Vibrio superstes]|nr:hypothetical protein [Vibrio superstes]
MNRKAFFWGIKLAQNNAQEGETYVMIKALNKFTGLGMPEI